MLAKRLSIVTLLAGCAAGAVPVAPVEIVPAVLIAASAAPSASTPVSAAEPEVPDGTQIDCSEAAADVAKDRVVRARAAGDPTVLRTALTEYLDVRPRDPDARLDLAALLSRQRDAAAAAQEATLALALETKDPAQAWLLVGAAADEAKDRERARAAYARASAVEPNGPGKALLAGRSACPGAMFRGTAGVGLTIVKGWLELFPIIEEMRMVHEELPAPTTEAEAKDRVCVSNDLTAIVERNACKGPGPWHLETGHLHFHDHRVIVVPLAAGRFAIVPYITGFPCRGGSFATASVHGDIIEVPIMMVDVDTHTSECDDGPHDAMTGPCIAGTHTETSYFDARMGWELLVVLEERGAPERHDVKNGRLRRRAAGGCDESVDLRRLPKTVEPRPG